MKQLLWILAFLPSTALAQDYFASLANIRSASPACEGKFSLSEESEGATVAKFNALKASRGDQKPYVRCRLLADIFVPAGHALSTDLVISAKVRGHFEKLGDQVAAKLHLSISNQRASDFQARRQADEITNDIGEDHDLELRAILPETRIVKNDRVITMSIRIEGMINYRLDQSSKIFAELDSITFPKLRLITPLPTNTDS